MELSCWINIQWPVPDQLPTNRPTPLVLSMWPCKCRLDEEKWKHADLAKMLGQNHFSEISTSNIHFANHLRTQIVDEENESLEGFTSNQALFIMSIWATCSRREWHSSRDCNFLGKDGCAVTSYSAIVNTELVIQPGGGQRGRSRRF
jgi:hypothetical protein